MAGNRTPVPFSNENIADVMQSESYGRVMDIVHWILVCLVTNY